MLHPSCDSTTVRFLRMQSNRFFAHLRSGFSFAVLPGLYAAIVLIAMPNLSLAQDWGEESYDNASRPAVSQGGPTGSGPSTGWSFRGGIGFTTLGGDPEI